MSCRRYARGAGLLLAVTLGALGVLPERGQAADAPWAVKNAPFRAVVRLKKSPAAAETGTEIEVPDLGVTSAASGDYALTDAGGKPLPVAVVWQGEAQTALLLARDLQPDTDYYLYIGGPRGATWTPQISLLFETRALAAGRGPFTSGGALQDAWNGASPQGARFVGRIFEGNNLFGEQTNFLSHYTGYLEPEAGGAMIYTDSSDASVVLVNGQPFVDFLGVHPAARSQKEVRMKKLPASPSPVRIDYYQAKGGEGDPAMCLGWVREGGKPEPIPAEAWLHPGTSEIVRYEDARGRPVLAPQIAFRSYLGWGGSFLYEVHCRLHGTDLKGAAVEWHFDDGVVFTGPECTRIMASVPPVQRVTVQAGQGMGAAAARPVTHRISFYGVPTERTAEGDEAHRHYLDLLEKEEPAHLTAASLGAALPFLCDHGTDAQIAPFAGAWLKFNPPASDPRWLPAELARLRFLAETNPQAALAALRNDNPARQFHDREINLFEVELLVFYLHDLSAAPRIQQIAFTLGDTREGHLAAIRLGDLYRLSGDVRQAIAKYEAAQPADPSGGRRLPAEDQANSLTVRDLIDHNDRQEAEAKLTEWEVTHPMAKFTTDFLLLRSRVLTLFGRWREALGELDAFAATHPDSPYQIDADYYRARALYELGRKDDARKIWMDLAKNYPKSELAASSKEWAAKP